MIKNYVRAQRKTRTTFELVYDDGQGSGFGFPCDQSGNLLIAEMSECGMANYQDCVAHPERYVRAGEVVRYCNTYTENAHGTCICGAEVELQDQYYEACQCARCGRWYNLYGQSLLPPEQWKIDPSEDEPW